MRLMDKLDRLRVGFGLTGRQHYRLYTIKSMPSLKVLDYVKISKKERDRADRLAKSAAGAALEEDVRGEQQQQQSANGGAKTFVPGEGRSAQESFTISFTPEEKAQIRELVANASSPAEIEEIERSVQRGVLPPQLLQNRKRAAEDSVDTTTATNGGQKKSRTEEQPNT